MRCRALAPWCSSGPPSADLSIHTSSWMHTEFHAVEVYNYLSALLGVTPVGNNGTANATLLREVLRTPPAWAVPALT